LLQLNVDLNAPDKPESADVAKAWLEKVGI
jgi:hypothetical protein